MGEGFNKNLKYMDIKSGSSMIHLTFLWSRECSDGALQLPISKFGLFKFELNLCFAAMVIYKDTEKQV